MGTKQYDSATDLITFSRASKGTALRKVSYGPEVITNGGFDGSTGWGPFGSSEITNGQARIYSSDGGNSGIIQNNVLEIGKLYRCKLDVTNVVQGTNLRENYGQTLVEIPANGEGPYTFTFKATSTSFGLKRSSGVTDIYVDNISVKEVTLDQAGGTLELFSHPDDIPRIEYDAAGVVKGLLIEENRTNLITYSEDYSTNTSFQNVTITGGSAASPAGTITASLIERNSTSSSYVGKPASKASSSLPFVFSIYAKKSVGSYFAMRIQGSYPGRVDVTFNLDTGAVSLGPTVASGGSGAFSLASATSVDCGNGWFRFILSATTDASNSAISYVSFNSNNVVLDGTDSSADSAGFIWGSQVEAGAFPTSYIPTAGQARTRAADVATIPTSAFGYNKEAGTVVCDFSMSFDGTNYPRVWEIGSTINNQDRINLYGNAPDKRIGCGFLTANTGQAGFTLSTNNTIPTAQTKVAFAWEENNVAAVQDGGTVQQDTSATLKGGNPRTSMGLGYTTTFSSDIMNGHIKFIQYYPRRLTNAQLQELTT